MPNSGFSWGVKLGDIADAVWTRNERALTQAKFPFWSSIITQVQGSISVPAGTSTYVNIQPPAGETWVVEIAAGVDTAGINKLNYCDFDGTTERKHTGMFVNSTTVNVPIMSLTRIISNALYAKLSYANTRTFADTAYYGYSGFKLSQPQWTPVRLKIESYNPFKRPVPEKYTLAFLNLREKAYLNPEGKVAYHLATEVLSIDPVKNVPVETVEYHVLEEDLVKGLTDFKSRPKETGWEKIFNLLDKEGITL